MGVLTRQGALLLALCALDSVMRVGLTHELSGVVDLRAVTSDGQQSFLDGGLGKLRFDEQHDGLRFGQISLFYRHDLAETLKLNIDAITYADGDSNAVDLTEAWLEWRPWPRSALRSKLKLGAFYAPISLENRLTGWRSPYTLSWSAINTWVGEEIRTAGLQYDLDWLGTKHGSGFDLGLTLGVFGWNDPAGVLIAARGWAMHDRQTVLFGRIGDLGAAPVNGRTLFEEIDHRPGYYVGANAHYLDRAELRALHYDNRGDRVSYSARIDDLAWETKFDAVGLVLTPTDHFTLIAQWLRGVTYIDPFIVFEWEFESTFLLASYERGAHRVSLRRDWFSMEQTAGVPPWNHDSGSGWTLAYLFELDSRWSLVGEAMQIDSTLTARAAIGAPLRERGRTLQVALRYLFKTP
ncbi:MAG: hypothetical protein ABIT36_11305 [Steroidobacteraceae bacterium]